MFPLSLLQSPHSPLCVCTEPALTLWPATRLILGQLEDDMLSMRSEMERRMQRVDQAYQLLSQDADTRRRIAQNGQSAAKESEKVRPKTDEAGKDHFELSLDVSRFSPEELTVKTEGRRLIVMGKHNEKRDAEDGSRFHEYREWRREAELPEDVNPEEVMSSLSQDGKLLIQAPRLALPAAAAERTIPISTTQTPVDGEGKSAEPRNSSEKEQPETGAHSSS